MKSILVTGGAGFIGSHTCIELCKKGFNVCIVDSLINSSENTIMQIKKILDLDKNVIKGNLYFKKGDLKDKKFLSNVFNEFKNQNNPFYSVIHFAGLKSVGESVSYPMKYWNNNLLSTINLAETMAEFNCNSLVFSSSATIYKSQSGKKLTEKCLKEPINPYGKTKLTIENMLEDLYESNNLKWKIANLRYFNPVGAHDSGLIGESNLNEPTNLFPNLLNVAMRENKEISIFGNDWPTNDGTCIRDYIHVMDLADAHVAALEFLDSNKPQIVSLNIGTGKGTSVLEIVKKFSSINNLSIPYVFAKRRKGDQSYVVADNDLALKLLNWFPKRSVNDMCIDAWRWAAKDYKND